MSSLPSRRRTATRAFRRRPAQRRQAIGRRRSRALGRLALFASVVVVTIWLGLFAIEQRNHLANADIRPGEVLVLPIL
jgi:hypothetical protein